MDRILGESASREMRMLAKLYLRNHRQLRKQVDDQASMLKSHMEREEKYRENIEAFHKNIESNIEAFTAMVNRGKGGIQFAIWVGGFVGFVWMIIQIIETAVGWVKP